MAVALVCPQIQLAFLVFKLDKPNDCNQNFVQVFKDNTDMPSRLNEFCGAKAETVLSENNVMHVRYWATSQAINATFDSLFTAYREGNKKPCLDDEFDCQDDTCISRTLRCNNRINCRFLWDEEKEECKVSTALAAPATSTGSQLLVGGSQVPRRLFSSGRSTLPEMESHLETLN
ncbi:uncharacterized protein LOC126092892 [Schistocerca cancellata]|uniref:uncharacterized protein LOC126092892 n=1 Tax=Schistocerca cancellata TaxID=274614 RepID=UPI002118F99C|nr:uncharacterized protein LOC126092892 [Schistocerca cancellata]